MLLFILIFLSSFVFSSAFILLTSSFGKELQLDETAQDKHSKILSFVLTSMYLIYDIFLLLYTGPGSRHPRRPRGSKWGRLFFASLTFLRPNFFSPVLDFSPSPLTAPGSPRMGSRQKISFYCETFRAINIP